jgi:hypothetical protein
MEELTAGQRAPLFQLVRYQRESKQEIVFATGQGWDIEIRAWDKLTTEEKPIAIVPREILTLWGEHDYIAFSERGLGGGPLAYGVPTFVLKQEALDYESFMRKPGVIRGILKMWQGLVEDIPSLVWGIVGGVVGGTVTAIVLKWLGLKP